MLDVNLKFLKNQKDHQFSEMLELFEKSPNDFRQIHVTHPLGIFDISHRWQTPAMGNMFAEVDTWKIDHLSQISWDEGISEDRNDIDMPYVIS